MKRIEHLQNVIAAERHDILAVLLRMENALTWEGLDSDLRKTYEEEILLGRRVVTHLGYLLDCCQRWHESDTTAPDVSGSELARDIDDGLDWPESMISESIDGLATNERDYWDYLRRCSRRRRLDHR